MMNISSSEAFLIFGKWRDSRAQLQVSLFAKGKRGGTPGLIIESSPSERRISVLIVADGQQAEWRFSLDGASFQYGEPSDSAEFPEFAEGKWSSYLFVELAAGDRILFAERLSG